MSLLKQKGHVAGKGHGTDMRKKTAFMGLFLAFALVLSYIESLVPVSLGILGVKLGLANLAVLLALYVYGWREALLLNLMRVLLSGFLFGSLFMAMYSMAGALCSFSAMCLLKRTGRFSLTGVSMAGGVFHNVGQLLTAFFVLKAPGVVFYLPVLLAAGIGAGFLMGRLSEEVIKYIRRARE